MANTALAYSAQRLLALNEGMLPTTVKLVCEGLARDFRVLSELKGAGWAGAFTGERGGGVRDVKGMRPGGARGGS